MGVFWSKLFGYREVSPDSECSSTHVLLSREDSVQLREKVESLKIKVKYLEDAIRILEQKNDKLESHILRLDHGPQERHLQPHQQPLSPARSHSPRDSKIELSDSDVSRNFKDLDSAIFNLVHKCRDRTDQTWEKTAENEPWAKAAAKTNTLSLMRAPWIRRQIANTIYSELFKSSLFTLGDEPVDQGLDPSESGPARGRFKGLWRLHHYPSLES